MIHATPHPLAGKIVTIQAGSLKGQQYRIEDWWDRVSGGSWMSADGNPACLDYAIRSGLKDNLPTDNEVVYGKINSFGKLVHVSEIESAYENASTDAERAEVGCRAIEAYKEDPETFSEYGYAADDDDDEDEDEDD